MSRFPQRHFAETIPLVEWAHLHSHLIWIYDGPVDPEGRQGIGHAPYLTAWLLRAGSVELKVGSRRFAVCAGDWFFPPPGQVWRTFSDDARLLSVRFRASWPGGEELFSEGLGLRLPARDYPGLERAARPLVAFVRKQFPRPDRHLLSAPATLSTHLRLQALFARWLDVCVAALTHAGLVPSRMGQIDSRVLRAVQLIEQQELRTAFDERTLAAQIGLSVSQLNRLFDRQFSISSRGYFERRRKEHALAALQGSSSTIKEIAYELGFSSLPHFSAWAKQQLGMAPSLFRQQTRHGLRP